ncbi:MAG: GAF domain-containing protein, partial [Acidimicrobiia bacterium]
MTAETEEVPKAIQREARVAGLRDFESPTLEAIERRRTQLWLIASMALIGLSGTAVLITFPSSPIGWVRDLYSVRILYLGFTVLISLYLVDKEFRLRRISRTLVDERVLNAALSNRLKEVSLLSDVGKAMNELLDLDDVLQMILDSAIELLGAQEGSIMLYDEDKGELVAAAWRSTREELLRGATVKLGDGISGWVAE